jgi:hypothetical protein
MGIFSRFLKRSKPEQDSLTKSFMDLKGYTMQDPCWVLLDISGNKWSLKDSGPVAMGRYSPKDKGTLYLDLSLHENKMHAIVLLRKTIELVYYPDETDTSMRFDATCTITGLKVKDRSKLLESLIELATARGFLFPPET